MTVTTEQTTNYLIDALGSSGGIIVAFSLLPQVIKTYRTKRADDISVSFPVIFQSIPFIEVIQCSHQRLQYFYQAIYIIGLLLLLIYTIYERLPVLYLPLALEMFFLVILTIMKMCYDDDLTESMRAYRQRLIPDEKSLEDSGL